MEGMRDEGDIVDASKDEVVATMDDKWVNSVIKRVEGSRHHTQWGTDVATIYRVAPDVRAGNPKAYEPSLVSVGPYHRGKKHLQTMEELKWQYVDHHISRCPERVSKYLGKMKELEAQTRRCYSEEIKLSSNEFLEMMLLDGCFLVQILLPPSLKRERPEQPLEETFWFDHLLLKDLLMLENQLPFFIVEFFLHEYQPARLFAFMAHISNYFRNLLYGGTEYGNLNIDFQTFQPHHLLHLFYECNFRLKAEEKMEMLSPSCCKPIRDHLKNIKKKLVRRLENWRQRKLQNLDQYSLPPRTIDSNARRCNTLNHIKKIKNQLILHLYNFFFPPDPPQKRLPTATELVEAGVKLKSRDKKMFLDISFHRGVLEIPPLHVKDSTNCILRNIIALEQCCPIQFGIAVTCYCVFMDSIINTPGDVALLQAEGIVKNYLGQNLWLATLFNNIGKNIFYDPAHDYLAGVTKGVNKYCESRWPKWRARLMHDYFNNPWAIVSLIAAVFLLLFTGIQTIYSVLSYYAR